MKRVSIQNRWPLAVLVLAALLVVVPLAVGAGKQSKAEFASSHELGTNRLTSATAELSVGRSAAVATAENMVPGDHRQVQIELSNDGSLPLLVTVDVESESGSALEDVLVLELTSSDRCDGVDPGLPSASLSQPALGAIRLAVGQTETVCLIAALPLSASNEIQGTTKDYTFILNGIHDLDA